MEKLKKILRKIGSYIPGYNGYANRSERRNSDGKLRNILSDKLLTVENSLIKNINLAIKSSDKKLMRELEEIRKEVNTTNSKLKFAPYGSSSFFANENIKEDELIIIYQYDLDISEIVENLFIEFNSLDLIQIQNSLERINSILKTRKQYIKEHK